VVSRKPQRLDRKGYSAPVCCLLAGNARLTTGRLRFQHILISLS
jgi:hypothetical protein